VKRLATRQRPGGGMKSELRIARQNRRARGELRMPFRSRGSSMLGWVALLLVLAIIAGILGFGGVMHAVAGIAQILFAVFLILLVLMLVFGRVRGRRT
jgi:uncharacterized membrane protein YtjA (UPF0391 family)